MWAHVGPYGPYGAIGTNVVPYGGMWSHMAPYGNIWAHRPHMASFRHKLPHMASYCTLQIPACDLSLYIYTDEFEWTRAFEWFERVVGCNVWAVCNGECIHGLGVDGLGNVGPGMCGVLPGDTQTVPRSEMYAVLTVLRTPPHGKARPFQPHSSLWF